MSAGGPDRGRLTRGLPSPERDSGQAVDDTIARAAFQGERALSVARTAFCLVVLLRVALVQHPAVGNRHAVVTVPTLVLAIGLSLYMVLRGWRHHRRLWLLTASSVLDAAVCFTALAPNSLWPVPAYRGIVRIPDTAALLIITAASGLRLSLPAAATATALNGGSLALLVGIDVEQGRFLLSDQAGQLSLWAIYLAGAGALASIVASRTRRLVTEGAHEALAAERTQRRLSELLQDHHDLRTTLSSATLNADLAVRVANEGAPPYADLSSRLQRLREDLQRADALVTAVRAEAAEETRAVREPARAVAAGAVASVLGQARRSFPGVTLSFHDGAPGAWVLAGGGERTLERILLNLVTNACEGDGARRATRVDVAVEAGTRPGWLRFAVSDDGPGFRAALLPVAGEQAATTKEDGTGIGLLLISGLLRANGSRLECANRAGGGAVAAFELPRAGDGGAHA